MKIVTYINQHLPIWSMLDGDHALKNKVNLLNSKLVDQPDFLSPIENTLRYEVFRTQRNWIVEKMGDRVSFALVEFSYRDLRDFHTCFKDITFYDYATEYLRSYRNDKEFKIGSLTKSHNDVDEQMWLAKKISKNHFDVWDREVLDPTYRNSEIMYALNRSIIMKDGNNHYVLDGTHRLTAYYLAARESHDLPSNLYGFMFERNYK